jgi:hypothetical protein
MADISDRFAELYTDMATSRDVSKMKLFGGAFKQMFDKVAVRYPDPAAETMEYLAAVEFNNYVTSAEAQEVASHFINDDGTLTGATEPSRGAHWKPEELKAFLVSRTIPLDEKPYYNWWALWLTVNMMYSDFANALVDLLGTKDQEHLAVACYQLALRKLKDADRPAFIRDYFHLN